MLCRGNWPADCFKPHSHVRMLWLPLRQHFWCSPRRRHGPSRATPDMFFEGDAGFAKEEGLDSQLSELQTDAGSWSRNTTAEVLSSNGSWSRNATDESSRSAQAEDCHPALAVASSDEHPAEREFLFGGWGADHLEFISDALMVLARVQGLLEQRQSSLQHVTVPEMLAFDQLWKGILNDELRPICDQSSRVNEALAEVVPGQQRSEAGQFEYLKPEQVPYMMRALESAAFTAAAARAL